MGPKKGRKKKEKIDTSKEAKQSPVEQNLKNTMTEMISIMANETNKCDKAPRPSSSEEIQINTSVWDQFIAEKKISK